MEDLTFGEQVKIILGRKGMTIKQLAEMIEAKTGKKMSRQNLTQRLGRDNFQEQDMRMIAKILDCPFQLSIMSDMQMQPRSTAALEQAANARTEAVEKRQKLLSAEAELTAEENPVTEAEPMAEESPAAETEPKAEESPVTEAEPMAEESPAAETEPEAEANLVPEEETERTEEAEPAAEEKTVQTEQIASDERDMTIGELYEIHQELSELEENAKAGEPVEEIKKELEKPKKERFHKGGIFLRKKQKDDEEKEEASEIRPEHKEKPAAEPAPERKQEQKKSDFEPVISHKDAAENQEIGDVNPYTGREYQSNSVRMHPTRIGYVQVYDRTIHKWTDMTEWAFLGLQERKKALLGSAYEPPIYLD